VPLSAVQLRARRRTVTLGGVQSVPAVRLPLLPFRRRFPSSRLFAFLPFSDPPLSSTRTKALQSVHRLSKRWSRQQRERRRAREETALLPVLRCSRATLSPPSSPAQHSPSRPLPRPQPFERHRPPFLLLLLEPRRSLISLDLHTSAATSSALTGSAPSSASAALCGRRFPLPRSEGVRASGETRSPAEADVVTRVFLLFRGVDESDAEGWRKADEVDWAKEVGIEEEKVKDDEMFSVLRTGASTRVRPDYMQSSD
jgi:hypothetical protein